MPGMDTGLSTNNPAVVSAFQSALLRQGLVVLLIVALVAVAWSLQRSAQLRQAKATLPGTPNGLAVLAAFDKQEGLAGVPNWRYLTGSLPLLRHVWAS